MKLYNNTTSEIEDKFYLMDGDKIVYTAKITPEELNALGYYAVVEDEDISTKYQIATKTEHKVDSIWKIEYVYTDMPLDTVKYDMYKILKSEFDKKAERPDVLTSLGFTVNGGRDDAKNFETGKKHALPQVKDVGGAFHDVTSLDYDAIISEIELAGIGLYQQKWAKEQEIIALIDVTACELYQNNPYDMIVDVVDANGNVTGTETVTYYQNKLLDWSI